MRGARFLLWNLSQETERESAGEDHVGTEAEKIPRRPY